ncbi:MAG: hypothetical protein ACJASL_004783 [Paraglaciecola sp.]|jgi:hypothetical protein
MVVLYWVDRKDVIQPAPTSNQNATIINQHQNMGDVSEMAIAKISSKKICSMAQHKWITNGSL